MSKYLIFDFVLLSTPSDHQVHLSSGRLPVVELQVNSVYFNVSTSILHHY
jgi:hypothetical protein